MNYLYFIIYQLLHRRKKILFKASLMQRIKEGAAGKVKLCYVLVLCQQLVSSLYRFGSQQVQQDRLHGFHLAASLEQLLKIAQDVKIVLDIVVIVIVSLPLPRVPRSRRLRTSSRAQIPTRDNLPEH